MQELIEDLQLQIFNKYEHILLKESFEKYLEKEKEQIEDAYCAGYKQGEYQDEILCDKYYNETYQNERIDTDTDRVY